jgi:hypothetical protein
MKLDLPKLPNINYKVILQKLSVFKNNMSLLVAIIIAVVSLLLFIPTGIIGSGLKKQVKKTSIENGENKIQQLIKDLKSPELKRIDQAHLDALDKDSNDITALAAQTTQRQYLKKEVFSIDPNSSTFSPEIFTRFGETYCSQIDQLIAAGKGGTSVTKLEIDTVLKELTSKSTSTSSQAVTRPQRSKVSSENLILSSYTTDSEIIVINQLLQTKAKSVSCYIDPLVIGGYKFWKNYTAAQYEQLDLAVANSWYYQLAYWVVEDVLNTIANINSSSQNVLKSPVKRLMSVSFISDIDRSSLLSFKSNSPTASSSSRGSVDKPFYVTSAAEGLSETYTARYCNDTLDVINFKIEMVISTKALFEFMQQLCSTKEHIYIDDSGREHKYKHNQITILETCLNSIDSYSADHELYSYGQDNVAKLDMVCEYIFIKAGYENVKPETVKLALSKKVKR